MRAGLTHLRLLPECTFPESDRYSITLSLFCVPYQKKGYSAAMVCSRHGNCQQVVYIRMKHLEAHNGLAY